MSIIFGVNCFHPNGSLTSTVDIRSCQMKQMYTNENKKQNLHIIKQRNSEIPDFVEILNIPFSGSLSSITNDTSAYTLTQIIANIIEYITTLTSNKCLNKVFLEKNAAKKFCQNIAVVCTNFENNFTFIIANSMDISRTATFAQLKKQAKIIIYILNYLFFEDKNNKIKNQNSQFLPCGLNCKLKTKTFRFLDYNYNNFHGIFCTKLNSLPTTIFYQLDGFATFPEPIPSLAETLNFELQKASPILNRN